MRTATVIAAIVVIFAPCAGATGWSAVHFEGIGFLVPPGAQVMRLSPERVWIDLPFEPGTTLREKFLLFEPAAPGDGPTGGIEIGGILLRFEYGSEGAVGSIYDYIRCSGTLPDGRRIVLTFVLHSVNPGVFDSPPPSFDRAREILAFWGIILSLRAPS